MKKIVLTIAFFLGLALTASAQGDFFGSQRPGGGLFGYGDMPETSMGNRNEITPLLPVHGQTDNQDASTPLGSGALLLAGLSAAYALIKKVKKQK